MVLNQFCDETLHMSVQWTKFLLLPKFKILVLPLIDRNVTIESKYPFHKSIPQLSA